MPQTFDILAAKIRSIGDVHVQNQMYVWPDFDPMDRRPKAFFKKRGIEFDGVLYIRYPVNKTIDPLSQAQLDQQERSLGLHLPVDYKQLLLSFGPIHLPGNANVIITSPADALQLTRDSWCYGDKPLTVLAISSYNCTCDGNSIGFIRSGDLFQPEVYEFNHELLYKADDPRLWTRKVGNSLTGFLLEYLAIQG